jgi:hypothetical protein
MKKNKFKIADLEETNGTSFWGDTVYASLNRMKEVFGEPLDIESGDGKVNFEWNFKLPSGTVFTIYDWKIPIALIEPDTLIQWHIGAHNQAKSIEASKEVNSSIVSQDDIII